MIDKVNKQASPIYQSKLDKGKPVEKVTSKKSALPENTTKKSLVDEILGSINFEDANSADLLQKELIVKTLTKALGEKVSSSSEFKLLIEKIELALINDKASQQRIKELLKTKDTLS